MRKFFTVQHPDLVFVVLVVIFVIAGLVVLMSASSEMAQTRFDDTYYFFKHQLLYGVFIGVAGFIAAALLPFKFWQKTALLLFVLNLILMVLVFTPLGFSAGGSDRWLSLFGYTFQPSELLKFTFIIYLASWLSKRQPRKESWSQGFLPLLSFIGVVTILLAIQPSTSTAALIFATSLIIYYAAGGRILFLGAAVVTAVVALALLVYVGPEYRMRRLMGFLSPTSDPLGSTYQINQTLIALGSGGTLGLGYGQSTTKLGFLPEPIGDSIFAVVGEEFGFLGTLIILFMFLFFMMRGYSIALSSRDAFPRLVTIGFVSLVLLQAFVHIGSVSGFIPFTGVPLPFVSYGGTAMLVLLTMCGFIFKVSRR